MCGVSLNIFGNVTAETSLNEKILAVVNVVRKKAETSATAIIEQINQIGSLLKLEQSIALGVRGSSNAETASLKLEDVEDEKTFVVFDSQNNKLMVQVNVKNMAQKDIRVYLSFDASKTIDVPLIKKGNIVKGILEDIPNTDFKIHIENK